MDEKTRKNFQSMMEYKRNSVVALYLAGNPQIAIVRALSHLKLHKSFVSRTIARYNERGSVGKRWGGGRQKTASAPEVVQQVKERLEQNPQLSGRKLAADLQISRTTVQRILKNDLKESIEDDVSHEFMDTSSTCSINNENDDDESVPYLNRTTTSNAQGEAAALSSVNEKRFTTKPTDTHQIFGDFVADQMRGMSASKYKRLKIKIQRAILEIEEEPDEPQPSPQTESFSVQVPEELSGEEFSIDVKEEERQKPQLPEEFLIEVKEEEQDLYF